MKYILAYGVVLILTPACFTLGTLLVGFPVSGCLAWASQQLRGVVAGTLSGLGGVAASVAFGYFIFRLILGSTTFGLFPLLAATLPLIIPLRKKAIQARLLGESVTKLRDIPAVQPIAMAVGVKFEVIGSVLSLIVVYLWLLVRA